MTWEYPLFKIFWDNDDIINVNSAIQSGMNWAIGPEISKFEKLIADYVGVKYCITCNSGTSALHSALLAYGIGNGDEVIVPSFSFIATANAPLFVHAKPVFADIENSTLGLDPEDVLEKITPKTKVIIPVHYGGCPCRIRELKEIAEDYNLLLIEDAAEAFGAKIGDQNIGAFGDSSILSFCQNKIITTGEGGAIVTNSKECIEKMKLICSHGRLDTSDYFSSNEIMDYVTLGYNFRMSNISASLGISQIKKIDSIIRMRREIAENYISLFSGLEDYILIPKPPSNYNHVYQLFSVTVKYRDELMKYLADKGIMSKIYFPPAHLTHWFKNILHYDCNLPVTENISESIISLPIYPKMPNSDTEYIVDEIRRFFELR
jgi:perosamine synthetase